MNISDSNNKTFVQSTLAYAVLAGLGLALIWWFVSMEHQIYFWDFRGYWVQYKDLGALAFSSPREFLSNVYISVRSSDYNSLIVSLPSLITYFTGDSRTAYLSTLFVIYALPFAVIFGLFAANFCQIAFSGRLSPWLYSLLAFSFMPIWSTLLRGEPDVAGMIGLTVLVWSVFRLRADRVHLLAAVLIGIAVWLPFLARRWYAFAVLPMALLAPFLTLYLTVAVDRFPIRKAAINLIATYFIAGAMTVGLLAAFQYELAIRVMLTSYGDIYDAYQREASFHFWRLYSHFGIFPLMASAAGIAIGLNKSRSRPYVWYALVCGVVTYALFIRTQQFENHHFLMIAFWLLFFQAIALTELLRFGKYTATFATMGYVIAVFVLPWTLFTAKMNTTAYLIPSAIQPMQIDQYPEYERLVSDLVSLGDVKIAVLASGKTFNDSMLSSISDEKLTKHFVPIPHVDKMHGFMSQPFTADYIVLTDPVATHLPRGQEVIRIFSEEFRRMINDGIYTQVGGDYHLAKGITATVFKKNRPIEKDDLTRVLEKIYAIYPDWRNRYTNSVLVDQVFTRIIPGDKWGYVWFNTAINRIDVHPGQTTPSVFTLLPGKNLAVSLVRPCDGSDGIVLSIEGAGSRIEKHVDSTDPVLFDTSGFTGQEITLTVSNNKNPTCDHTYIKVVDK